MATQGASLPKQWEVQPRTSFWIRPAGASEERILARHDAYAAAEAFIDGRIDIEGDLCAAIRQFLATPRRGLRHWLAILPVRCFCLWPERWWQGRVRARRNIESHYDHSPDFYRQFLDRNLVYSCAYFEEPGMTLDEAQSAKLDLICRKLNLRPGERFLDVGCGFGALVARAAEHYAADSTGCTLSIRQAESAARMLRQTGLASQASVQYADYRDLSGTFDKIASVGMFEHVGVRRLQKYFGKVYDLLAPEGLFLNHGIARPQTVPPGPDWRFLQRRVFPGGELPHLSEVVREAEKAGFEVLDVENLRPHYGRTCRTWVERLIARADACSRLAGRTVYRTFLLYLAASAVSFEDGLTEVHQVLLAKRSSPQARHWTRSYIYR